MNNNLIFILVVLIPSLGFSQKLDDAESVLDTGDTIYYDFRLHRNPALIFKENIEMKTGPKVQLYRGHPIISVNNGTASISKGNFSVRKFYKLDLQTRPYIYSEFGDFRESLRTQIGIAPRMAIGYGGLYGVFQWFFPIQNDFPDRFGFQNRPGEIGVGFTKILNGVNFFNSFLGTFTSDRYGGYLEYIRSSNDQRVYIGSSIYYTGRMVLSDGVIFRERVNYISGEVFALYRFKQPNLSVRIAGERFLREDTGISLELMRQFGNTDIGFSVTESDNGTNARMFVAFSLGGKFYSNKWFQLRPPHTFRFSYDLQPNTGIAERTRPFTNFFYDIYRFNRLYIQSQLNRYDFR